MKKACKNFISALLSLALFAGLFTGCQTFNIPNTSAAAQPTPTVTPKKPSGGDNIFSINFSPEYGINPFNGLNKINQPAATLVYEGLFVLDEDYNIRPVLCDSWTTEGGNSYTFVIKQGVTFHDGAALTANDVVYSLNQAKKSGQYSERFSKVTNITALGSNTVKVALSRSDMMFPALLDVPVIKSGDTAKNPVGTGPYKFISDSNGNSLNAYEGWRNYKNLPVQKIYLQEFNTENIISAFENSNLDLVFTDPLDISSVNIKGNGDTHYFDTTNLQYIGFNMHSSAFSNSELRRAINYVVNRENIAGSLMSYSASEAYVPTLLLKDKFGTIKTEYSFSPDKAKAILNSNQISDYNNDGLLEYKSGGRFTVKFLANKDNPFKLAAAKSIADTLIKLGVSVDFRQLSWNDYLNALKSGDFDMYYAEVKLPADFDLSSLFSGGTLNFGGIRDSAYNILMDAYLAADDGSREAAAQALYSDIAKTAPIVPVVFRRQAMVTKRGVVLGAAPSQSNIFYGIDNWKISLG